MLRISFHPSVQGQDGHPCHTDGIHYCLFRAKAKLVWRQKAAQSPTFNVNPYIYKFLLSELYQGILYLSSLQIHPGGLGRIFKSRLLPCLLPYISIVVAFRFVNHPLCVCHNARRLFRSIFVLRGWRRPIFLT